jgi:4'-phosphopantetheinyl transferase
MRETHLVHVWYADRRAMAADAIDALVTAEDRQRVTPTMHERRRVEYLATRALLRHALREFTGRDGGSFKIEVTTEGKPHCADGPAISLSHSGNLLVCAIASWGALGVDAETSDREHDVEAIAERFFTPAEASWIVADPAARFLQLWVLKEAYLKALGVGLPGGLTSLQCVVAPPRVVARLAAGAPAPQLALLEGGGCYLAVATIGVPQRLTLELHRFSGERGPDAFAPQLVARTD